MANIHEKVENGLSFFASKTETNGNSGTMCHQKKIATVRENYNSCNGEDREEGYAE